MLKTRFVLANGIFAGGVALALALMAGGPVRAAESKPKAVAPAAVNLDEINDLQIEDQLALTGEAWLKEGKAVKLSALIGQLKRTNCSLQLPPAPTGKLSATETLARYRAGILVVAELYKCPKCPRWHVTTASGFMLTAGGAFTTSYHVVNEPKSELMLVMTGDGRIAPVKEVLAASKATDTVILQLEGGGYTPLPLDGRPPVGSTVRVVSHPDGRYYTLTEGIVSRYFVTRNGKRARDFTMMDVTADFAGGSSGGPVFNDNGAVVGVVNSTESIYYDVRRNRGIDLQMVFKHCIPSLYVRELVRP